jgi:hypothetical protein
MVLKLQNQYQETGRLWQDKVGAGSEPIPSFVSTREKQL